MIYGWNRYSWHIINILIYLYENNIVYPDITGYNFIVEEITEKLWLVDYEHSFFLLFSSYNEHNQFVEEFIQGKPSWNPYFA